MKTLVKNMLIVAIAMICSSNIAAQESIVTFKDSTEYAQSVGKGLITSGENLEIDTDYMDLADLTGGRPWDAKIKKGIGQGRVITGWYIGLNASATSDIDKMDISPKISLTGGNYMGWGDVNVNIGVTKGMKFLGEEFNALSSSLGLEITLCHFGGRESVDTEGLTKDGIKRAIRNEKYGRTWRLYLEARVGYQYCFKKTEFTSEDNTASFTGVKDGSSVSYGGGLGLEKRFKNTPSRIGMKVNVESFQFKSNTEKFQPVYGQVSFYYKFNLNKAFRF